MQVRKSYGQREVLAGVSLDLRPGEVLLVRGGRGAGKTTLARLLLGLIHPDEGDIRRERLPAPLLGGAAGFEKGAPVSRGLDLRAAAYGVSTRDYVRAVAALMDAPERLAEPFGRLTGRDRQIVTYASVWLLPATLFVAEGRLLPPDRDAKDRIRPLWRAQRAQAAVVWIADLKADPRHVKPERVVRLERGRLIPEPPPEG